MARIELPLEEWEASRKRIKDLEKLLVQQDKEIDKLREENMKYHDAVEYIIDGVSKSEIFFQWKKVKNIILETIPFYTNGEKEESVAPN